MNDFGGAHSDNCGPCAACLNLIRQTTKAQCAALIRCAAETAHVDTVELLLKLAKEIEES